jgi:ABC-type transport system involved in multi-copper enzyme maturation permease subunit
LQYTFCTPRVGRGFYRWWLQRKLRRNPIGWLDQRTWQARVIMWTWLAVLVSIYSSVLASGVSFVREFDAWQRGLSLLLLMTMAGTSAASFHRERESGVLELLLVSPLSVGSVLWGRLRGLWAQFMPSLLLVVVVWIHMNVAVGDFVLRRGSVLFETLRCATFALGYFCVPVIGLYFSLRLKHFLSAFAWTLMVALFVPMALALVGVAVTPEIHLPTYGGEVGDGSVYALVTMTLPCLVLAGIAGTMLLGLRRILTTRQFLG